MSVKREQGQSGEQPSRAQPAVTAVAPLDAHDLAAALSAAEQRATEAEQKLLRAEQQYQRLVAETGQWAWTANPERKRETDDDPNSALPWQREDDAQGEAMHPDDRARLIEVWIRAQAAQTPFEATYRLQREDGKYREILVRGTPVLHQDGTVYEWMGTCADVTSLRQLEERLRHSEQMAATHALRLDAIFDAITDGIYVYDRDGHLVQANLAARATNPHVGEHQYLARPFAERVSPFDIRDGEGRMLAVEEYPISRVMRGEVLTGENAADTVMQISGGTLLLNTTGAPVLDQDGQLAGAVIVTRDVTEQRRLAQRTGAALDAMLAMADILVRVPLTTEDEISRSTADPQQAARQLAELARNVLGCSRASINVIDSETLVMRPLVVVGLPTEQEHEWRQTHQQEASRFGEGIDPERLARLRQGEPIIMDMQQPPFNAQPNPFNIHTLLVAPMRIGEQIVGLLALDHSGAPHSYTQQEVRLAEAVGQLAAFVVERERLQREQTEAQARLLALEATNRLMNEFLGIAGHELRTPLTSAKANVQMAARLLQRLPNPLNDMRLPAELRETLPRLDTIFRRTGQQLLRQERIINDLLDVSHIQAGGLEMQPIASDLAAIVRDCVEEQRLLHPERTLSLDAPAQAVPVLIDPDRIAQVVTNYLTNALKYSTGEKPVRVRLDADGQIARVGVRDEGPGLPPSEHARVWEPFQRAAGIEVQSGSGVGLGLGLHISRTIVERSGGQVGVESAPGHGSTFWFTLPLAPETGEALGATH